MKNITLEKSLAFFALILAFFAAITGDPQGAGTETIKQVELSETSVKFIQVQELAEWIIQKKNDFELIDIRDKKAFDKYHIQFATNIPYDLLVDKDFINKTKNILYWQNERFPQETMSFIKNGSEEKIYVLRGGINAWIDKIIFPDISKIEKDDQAAIAKISRTSRYFGGKPKNSKKTNPKIRRKYNREGC